MNYYNKLSKFLSLLREFDFYQVTSNTKTQKRSAKNEDYTEQCLTKVFEEAQIFKNGSQEHPDFYVVKNQIINEKFGSREKIELMAKKKKIKSKKGILDKYVEKKNILKVEVKSYTKTSSMIFNNTFPNPNKLDNTLYIFFSYKEKRVFINTSYCMSNQNPYNISEKFTSSKENIKNCQKKSNSIWAETNLITTSIRPTYIINIKYFDFPLSNQMKKNIISLFKKVS